MSPDQVTRAAPGKRSNVSPGDSIGGIVFWGKEIMYHRQQKKKKISPQPLPSPGRLLPCHVRSKKGALSAEGAGGYVAVGIEEAPGIIHTHTQWRKEISFNIGTDTTHYKSTRKTYSWGGKKPLAIICALEDGQENLLQESPSATRPWKDPDAGKDWRREEKGMTEDEVVGWHHWLDGHEFE